jgi:hypothetical protein
MIIKPSQPVVCIDRELKSALFIWKIPWQIRASNIPRRNCDDTEDSRQFLTSVTAPAEDSVTNPRVRAGAPFVTYTVTIRWSATVPHIRADTNEKIRDSSSYPCRPQRRRNRDVTGTGWGLDGLPFSRAIQQYMKWRGPHTAMISLVIATGAGYMCNAPSMNCSRTPANVEVKEINTGADIEAVLYPLVLFAKNDIQTGDEFICKYHQSGSVNPRFHFDCLDETHYND